jgi:hypothetical protein
LLICMEPWMHACISCCGCVERERENKPWLVYTVGARTSAPPAAQDADFSYAFDGSTPSFAVSSGTLFVPIRRRNNCAREQRTHQHFISSAHTVYITISGKATKHKEVIIKICNCTECQKHSYNLKTI